jgi:hypothetical protein
MYWAIDVLNCLSVGKKLTYNGSPPVLPGVFATGGSNFSPVLQGGFATGGSNFSPGAAGCVRDRREQLLPGAAGCVRDRREQLLPGAAGRAHVTKFTPKARPRMVWRGFCLTREAAG